jgi:hypothetical protein
MSKTLGSIQEHKKRKKAGEGGKKSLTSYKKSNSK